MTKSCFIMGLPNAGKSTFLAALWHSLGTMRQSQLTLDRFEGDLSYLSNISDNWEKCVPVSRTSQRELKKCVLRLKKDDAVFECSFPDVSGETFQDAYILREIDKSLVEYLKDCLSMLLFINFDDIIDPIPITSVPQTFRDNQPETELVDRDPKRDPTEVQLVDLLQFVKQQKKCVIRIGVVISLWDMVVKEPSFINLSPKELIIKKLPLLWQYLESNCEFFNVSYFGISAQGGDVLDPLIRDELLDLINPSERIVVVDNTKSSYNDITKLLAEIIGD